LRAETDGEHRLVVLGRMRDEPHLFTQVGVAIGFVDPHRPAEHDQSARPVEGARHRLAVEGVDVTITPPPTLGRLRATPERFAGDVPQDDVVAVVHRVVPLRTASAQRASDAARLCTWLRRRSDRAPVSAVPTTRPVTNLATCPSARCTTARRYG